MMTRDDRFYAFIVARTSRSRAHIRRVCVHKRWLKLSALVLFVICGALIYGFYGLTQQAAHIQIERENARLRAQNEKQQQELQNLNNRVNAVEDTSRKLAEIS
jgi:cell division protein FtsL